LKTRVKALQRLQGFQWGKNHSSFDRNINNLIRFVEVYGEYPKQEGLRCRGYEDKLANFVQTQRFLYKVGKLADDRFELLTSIEFDWGKRNTPFMENVESCKDFQIRHGDVPRSLGSRDASETRLAKFLHNQRYLFRKGNLTDVQMDALESIPGFSWWIQLEGFWT
jgi:hypothetical protein